MISQTSDPPDSHPQNSHSQTSHLYRLLAHTLLTHRLLTNRLQYSNIPKIATIYIYLRSPFLCLYMLCSHHQFFSFSILSKGKYIDSHHSSLVITLFMASQWLQKARSTPPIYAFFVPTGKACPQTLKLTMFPITFSPSLRLAFII